MVVRIIKNHAGSLGFKCHKIGAADSHGRDHVVRVSGLSDVALADGCDVTPLVGDDVIAIADVLVDGRSDKRTLTVASRYLHT